MFLDEKKEKELLECFSCEAVFAVDHEMDEEEYEVIYCPFCSEKVAQYDPDDWFEE